MHRCRVQSGQGERQFSIDLIRKKIEVTQNSTIALNVLVINLDKLLELLFVLFCGLATPSPGK